MDLSLLEIRDGILRGNKKTPYFKGYSVADPKFSFIQVTLNILKLQNFPKNKKKKDPRLLCIIGYNNKIEKKLFEFRKDNLWKVF